ncbi:hypothetical protein [Leucobacter soli]|uniref:hypothetical protein n=1 Tax=Leucobacter soli TaxID=2812850 RepID=UPI0036227FA8
MNPIKDRRPPVLVVALALCTSAALGIVGCAREAPEIPAAPATQASGSPSNESEVETTGPLLTSGTPVGVMGTDEETRVCFYGETLSLPPGCLGPLLIGWDWAEHPGEYREYEGHPGRRHGQFIVTGYLDETAGTFTLVKAGSADEYVYPEEVPDEELFATACPEPEGGWRVLDETKTNEDTMYEMFEAAEGIDGFSMSWIDSYTAAAPDAQEHSGNDPKHSILNVKVVDDVEAAEAALREIWGGMLCITTGKRTQAELLAMQREIHSEHEYLSSAPEDGEYLGVSTLYDDGTLQREFDRRYGAGQYE